MNNNNNNNNTNNNNNNNCYGNYITFTLIVHQLKFILFFHKNVINNPIALV